PGTRARLWRGFSRTDGCVGVAISTVGVRASLSPLRPTARPLLPPPVASGRWHNPCRRTPHDHPHGSDCPSPWRHARCPWSRPPYVRARFSNRPVGVKHFQTIHQCGVDVARGLVLLFGIGTKALVWGFLCQGVGQGGEAFLRRFLGSISKPVSPSRPAHRCRRGAQNLSRVGCPPTFPECFALARPYH